MKMKIGSRLMLTCLAAAIGQALPLSGGLGVAMADVVVDGDVSPAIPPEGGLVQGPIVVGETSQGSLTMADGESIFTDVDVTFGARVGAMGNGVFGRGAILSSETSIFVGYEGAGALNLTEGATIASGGYFGLGDQAGSSGNVTLDASRLEAGELRIGNGGSGELFLSNGAVAQIAGTIGIGDQAGSLGTVTLTGAGTALNTAGGGIYVAVVGHGSLNLGDGATATTSDVVSVGDQAGSFGAVSLTGQGTKLTAGSTMYVGALGDGSLSMGNGAAASIAGDVSIGDQAGGQGTATLAGQGTTLTSDGQLYVGASGTGALTVSDGASVSVGSVDVGSQAGSGGTIELSGLGTLLAASGDLYVGNSGDGELTLRDGASASAGGTVRLGEHAGSTGIVSLTGAGTMLSASDRLGVGNFGNGTLSILDGAKVEVLGLVGVGTESTSQGILTISGQDSALTTTGPLAVGTRGIASMTISDGATASSDGLIYVGVGPRGQGTVSLSGQGSTLSAGSTVYFGFSGTANVDVEGGATVATQGQVSIGELAGSSGIVSVAGAGSSFTAGAGGLLIGNLGSGVLTVSGGASVTSSEPIVLASQAGSQGELVIGSAAGTAPGATGAVEATLVNFGAGTGKVTFNHTDSAYAFAPGFSGNGTIDHLAGTTLFNGDGAAFTGITTVQGGSLYVNQALGGTISVHSGSTLGGSGSIGALTVAGGGTVRPGAATSPGYQTLTVMGDYHAQAGSVHLAEINAAQPGQSDLLKVQGTATLDPGSVLNIQFANTAAGFTPGTRYTLLSADQGVAGTYTLSNSLPQLSAVLGLRAGYDGQSAYVDVTQVRSLPEVGSTPNEQAVLGAVQELPVANPVYLTVINQPTDLAVRERAVELSGEAYASAQAAWIDHSRYLREAVTGRLRQGENGPGALRGSEDTPWSLWAHFVGAWGHMDGDNGTARVKSVVNGVMAGADRQIGEQGRIGLVAGSTHTSLKSSRMVRSSGDDVTFGMYGGAGLGAFKLRTGVADTRQKLDVNRQASLLDGSGFVTGRAKAHLGQAFIELGYPIGSETKSIEPFAQVAYVRLRTDGFQEQGDTNALVVDDARHNTTLTTLGARGSWNGTLQGEAFSLHGALGWRHASGYVDPSSSLRFADGTTDFAVNGVPLSRNAAVVDVGMLFQIRKSLTFDIAYNGQLASGSSDNAIKATAVWQF